MALSITVIGGDNTITEMVVCVCVYARVYTILNLLQLHANVYTDQKTTCLEFASK